MDSGDLEPRVADTEVVLEGLTFGDACMAVGLIQALLGFMDDRKMQGSVAYSTAANTRDKVEASVAEAAVVAGMQPGDARHAFEDLKAQLAIFHQDDR